MKAVHYNVAKLIVPHGMNLRVRLENLLYEYGQQGWELVQWDIIPQNLSSNTDNTTTILVTFKKVRT